MWPCLRLPVALSSRLVDTGYIKSSFVPVTHKQHLAYPGRESEVERVLAAAEQRFEKSLAMQALAAPVERDLMSGLEVPRTLALPLTFMAVSRRLEQPAALAAAKAMAEEEARAVQTEAKVQTSTDTASSDADSEDSLDSIVKLRSPSPNNKKARKLKAASKAAALALQGPSMPWNPPEMAPLGREKRKEVLPDGERRFLVGPLDTRRLRESRARKATLKAASAARTARAWTVWYDIQIRPQLSFVSSPPRDEVDSWPPVSHPDIYFPHTKRDWILLHPAFVHAMSDLNSTFAAKLISQNTSPGQENDERDDVKPKETSFGLMFTKRDRWTRGTPLGPTKPLRGDTDPWIDRPLRLPVAASAEEAAEGAIREKLTLHVPVNLPALAHCSLQAELLVAAGWTPDKVLSLFPALEPVDLNASLSKLTESCAPEESKPNALFNDLEEERHPKDVPDDVPGADMSKATQAGFSSDQVAKIRALLNTDTLIKQGGGIVPGEGLSPTLLSAINERASSFVALCAHHPPMSTSTTQQNPIVLRPLPLTQSVAIHLWRLVVWRHQPYAGLDALLDN